MYKHILVPYDKSEHAKNALKAAIDLATTNNAPITVLYVAEVPEFDDPTFEAAAQMAGMGRMTNDQVVDMQKEFYARAKAVAEQDASGVAGDYPNIEYLATSGKPHVAIAEFADTGKYDIIVMGCRGLGALRGALGSVSYAVLRTVDLPVLIVK